MARKPVEPDPFDADDMFSDTRMTFGEHIEDLRTHLMRAIKGFVLGIIIALIIGKPVVQIITEPVETQLRAFDKRYLQQSFNKFKDERARNSVTADRRINISLRLPAEFVAPEKRPQPSPLQPLLDAYARLLRDLDVDRELEDYWQLDNDKWVSVPSQINETDQLVFDLMDQMQVIKPRSLTTLSVQEAFMVYFKVSLMTGLVISSPWVFYQIWSFVAAGLYPHEKRLVNVYLPVSLALFLIGVFVCQFLVLPKAIEALLWFNEWLGMQPDLRLNEWLGFAIFMPLVFGISFQTPLVMLFTFKIGLFGVDSFKSKRRIAWMAMAFFAAFITPSTDAFSMLFLWVPMSLLYELGIFLCQMQPKSEWELEEESDRQELVEV